MIRLLQRECAVLPLVLEGRWFNMIAAGEKKEEYREFSPYWDVRLKNWDSKVKPNVCPVVEFRWGYSSTAPRMMFYVLGMNEPPKMTTYAIRNKARHPEWGEPEENLSVGYTIGGEYDWVLQYSLVTDGV